MFVFMIFAALISYMVYRCAIMPVSLVANEYYKDELAYQQVIDGTKMANALSAPVSLQKNDGNIILQLPAEMKRLQVTGSVLFYCPSNEHNDKKMVLTTNGDGQQIINAGQLARGKYVVKIDWQANNTHYYSQQLFTIL